MKGKSLRGIVILALVVCALLAVASNAFAATTWYDGASGLQMIENHTLSQVGTTGLVGWLLAQGDTFNLSPVHPIYCGINTYGEPEAGAHLILAGGKVYVRRAVVGKQRITCQVFARQYTTTQGWHDVQKSPEWYWDLPYSDTYYQQGYAFPGEQFALVAPGYYRLRVLVKWLTTSGSLLGYKWIGFRGTDYMYLGGTASRGDDGCEGWVLHPPTYTGTTFYVRPPSL